MAGVDIASTKAMTLALSKLNVVQQQVALSSLKKAGADTAGVEACLAAASSTSTLADAEIKDVLAKNGVVGASAEQVVASAASTTAKTVEAGATNVLTTALWNNIKALGVWLVTNPVGWCILAAGAVAAVTWGVNQLTTSLKGHQQMLDDAKSSYNDTASQIETLNSKLSDTQSKIKDLEGKDKLSLTDEQELSKLKDQSSELEKEILLNKKLLEQQDKKKAESFVSTVNADFNKDTEYASGNSYDAIGTQLNDESEFAYLNDQLSQYKSAKERLNKALSGQDRDAIDLAKAQMSSIDDTLGNGVSRMKEYLDDATYYTGDNLEQWQKDSNTAYDSLSDFVNKYLILTGDADSATTVFNSIFDSSKFASAHDALEELGDQGSLTADKLKELYNTNDSVKQFIDYLISLGLISFDNLDTLANQLNAVGDATDSAVVALKSISDIYDDVKDKADAVSKAQTEMNESGVVSVDTMMDLIKAGVLTENQFIETANGYTISKNALQSLDDESLNSYQIALNDAQDAAQSVYNAELLKQSGYNATTDSILTQLIAQRSLLETKYEDLGIGGAGLSDFTYTDENGNTANYGKTVSAIQSILNAQNNLNKAQSLYKNLSKENKTSSSGTSSEQKETEEYIADIDKLSTSKEKLAEIQNDIQRLSSINEVTDNDIEKVQNLNQIIILYQQEQEALHALNQERRNEISAQVDTLKSQGFDVLYDPDSNKLVINNLEHINKLQGNTMEKTNEIRKAAEKLIDTVQSENNDAIQSSQDWLGVLKNINGAYNDIKQSAKDALEESQKGLEDDINSIKSTVGKAFDEISKLLNKEKESYETQKSNLESVASTVTSYINTYTDSLQSENDELEKQISLQQKLEALDKAKTQRNKRIFKKDEGFVWGTDESAVNSAQEEYDSALREYNLNEQIQELKDYAKAWQDAVNSYETSANEALTASILGSNWKSKVLGTNYSLVKNFKGDYTNVLSELDDSVYGSVAYQIKNLDNLKDEWSNTVDEAEDTSTDYETVLNLVKAYESSNYSDRLNEMSKFVTSMKEQYKELTAAYQTVTDALPTATSGSIQYSKDENYAQKILDSTTLSEAQAYAALRDAKISGENITDVASTQSFLDNWKTANSSKSSSSSSSSSSGSKSSSASSVAKSVVSAIGSVVSTISKSILGFSEGGVVSDTGLAMLHGGNGHNEVVLNSDDASSLWSYLKSTDILSQSAANLLVSSSLSSGNNVSPNSNQSISLNIGDIYLSGINDSNSLADEIVRKLPGAVLQKIYSKKKRR